MKKIKIQLGLIALMGVLVIALVTTTSCKKDDDNNTTEKVKGCTDPTSLTYNPLAEEDDGSCVQVEQKERALFMDFTATW
jgi:hypothetical protein